MGDPFKPDFGLSVAVKTHGNVGVSPAVPKLDILILQLRKSLTMWFTRPRWPDIPAEEIKKRARLLVIDDDEFPYQTLFERDGYTLEKWPDVIDLPKLESGFFDIVLLDLQGVGRQQSSEQGLGILRHLRKTTPAQIIIAYSSADWPLKYQEFFEQADAVLGKSSDYVDFKRKVDQLLEQRFSIGFYIARIQKVVGPNIDDPVRLERLSRDSILGKDTSKLRSFLEDRMQSPEAIGNVLSLVQTAIAVASLWKS
jgi:CheY-like chemotaxis protein